MNPNLAVNVNRPETADKPVMLLKYSESGTITVPGTFCIQVIRTCETRSTQLTGSAGVLFASRPPTHQMTARRRAYN